LKGSGQNRDELVHIDRSIAGDRKSQHFIYSKYADAMFHTARRITGNAHDAEDVLQETFIKVFRYLERFKRESSLGTWIKAIAVNTAITYVKRRRDGTFLTAEPPEVMSMQENGYQEDFDTIDIAKVHQAIDELPKGSRIVLSLYVFEGYKHREIAEILEVSESTSKTQYLRAKSLLREKLKDRLHG
jgi:RNA polymerase sigma factor (sigma-70 family)